MPPIPTTRSPRAAGGSRSAYRSSACRAMSRATSSPADPTGDQEVCARRRSWPGPIGAAATGSSAPGVPARRHQPQHDGGDWDVAADDAELVDGLRGPADGFRVGREEVLRP